MELEEQDVQDVIGSVLGVTRALIAAQALTPDDVSEALLVESTRIMVASFCRRQAVQVGDVWTEEAAKGPDAQLIKWWLTTSSNLPLMLNGDVMIDFSSPLDLVMGFLWKRLVLHLQNSSSYFVHEAVYEVMPAENRPPVPDYPPHEPGNPRLSIAGGDKYRVWFRNVPFGHYLIRLSWKDREPAKALSTYPD